MRIRHAFQLAALVAGCGSLPATSAPAVESWGFVAPWDARSDSSAAAWGQSLDALVVGWIGLDSVTGLPSSLYPARPVHLGGPRRMAIVTSYALDHFHPQALRTLALDSVALARSAERVAELAVLGQYRGLVFDFEEMTPRDTVITRAIVDAFAAAARRRGIGPIVVALPATDTAAYPARLFPSADLLMPMLYDEHWVTSPAGPIASPDWVRRTLSMRAAEAGAGRLVAALPLYGYLWRPGHDAVTISLSEARRLSAEAGVALDRDASVSTLHAKSSGTAPWELWVADSVLVDSLRAEVRRLGVRRVAYWRLGLER